MIEITGVQVTVRDGHGVVDGELQPMKRFRLRMATSAVTRTEFEMNEAIALSFVRQLIPALEQAALEADREAAAHQVEGVPSARTV